LATYAAPAAQSLDPSVGVPEGMQIASIGRRVGAWILDSILVGFLALIPLIAVFITGALTFNQQAWDQYDEYSYYPWDGVTAPLFNFDVGGFAAVGTLWLVLLAAYFVVSWMTAGGTPGQRALNVKVVDKGTGQRLRLDQALIRWIVLTGVASAVGIITVALFCDWMARTPANQWLGQQLYYERSSVGPSGLYSLLAWLPLLWSILLLVTTGLNNLKRGWHDKLAESIVISPLERPIYAAAPYWPPQLPAWPPQPAPGYPQPPAWPPQGGAAYPQQGYPRPAPGYPQPPAWPPQGGAAYPQQGYPWPAPGYPQPPAWPPQAPGYPPVPGYPPYPQPGAPAPFVPPGSAPQPPTPATPPDGTTKTGS
jgi:uncharacterized RDD family membrane protein YckC